jgi:leucyl-tRNA synthetase
MEVAERPYAFVKHQMARGQNDTSFLSHLLEQKDLSPDENFVVKWSALSLYTAGADTVCFTTLYSLFHHATGTDD